MGSGQQGIDSVQALINRFDLIVNEEGYDNEEKVERKVNLLNAATAMVEEDDPRICRDVILNALLLRATIK